MLKISDRLSLPVEAITQTFGILAVRGAGKSNLAAVMAEEMFDARLPFVVIDPVGAWWGLRSSGDGRSAGIPVPIFGGRHGDVPLERAGGNLIADLVVEHRLSCVLDVSELSEGDKVRFLCDFAERLYRRNTEPLHLFLEEADDYAPQRPMREQARLLRAWENIVRRGRARGLGITMVTQRSAALNKNVLTQIETLFVLRTTSPQDRKAIAAWVEYYDQSRDVLESLPSLMNGEAWVWSPYFLKTIKRVHIRRRRTFDSAATPKQIRGGRKPATLADVDLAAIGERMQDTIERAKEIDPTELQKRIADLERRLRAQPKPEIERVVDRIEIPIFKDSEVARLEKAVAGIQEFGAQLVNVAQEISGALRAVTTRPMPAPVNPVWVRPVVSPAPRAARTEAAEADVKLPKAERSILSVLAQYYPQGRNKTQLAILAGYSVKGGGFNNAIGALRSYGFIRGGKEHIEITDAGLSAIGSDWELLPTGRVLIDYWLRELPKAERSILSVLVDAYPNAVEKTALAEAAGYQVGGGGFNNALGKLRTLELARGRNEIRASDALFE